MTEEEYIIKSFGTSFEDMKDKKIALYGLGKNTETIINSFPDYQIICLLDGYKTDGELYGKPIYSLKNAFEAGIDFIIIVARANSAKIILKRIEEECRKACIDVFDIHGTSLLNDSSVFEGNDKYFNLDIDAVKNAIDKSDAVSFDIFDTLITRLVPDPYDAFEFVEKNSGFEGFAKSRIEAERNLNRTCVPTIDDIYQVLVSEGIFSEKEVLRLKELEISFEKKLLIPRKEAVSLFGYAKEKGKKVSLISDMYLGKDILESVLKNCGIEGYDNLLISCDYGKKKTTGLYKIYKDKVKANHYLHLGDDQDGDIEFAKMNGINAIRILKPADMAEISSYKEILDLPESIYERLMTGMVISSIFNSPFALFHSAGRPTIDNAYELGFALMGPLMTGFIYWLIKNTEEKYDRILFAARDGYVVQKMYKIVDKSAQERKLPKNTYFYTSRMASIAAGIRDDEDLRYAAGQPFSGELKDLLKKRFYLSDNEIKEPEENETSEQYCLRHKEAIFRRSEELRKNYLKYIEKTDIEKEEKLVFFDLVSSGSCQLGTESIMEREIPGLYFIHVEESYRKKANLKTKAYIESGLLLELKSYMALNYEPIEGITAPHDPTLLRFDDEGNPIFGKADRTDEEINYIDNVQDGILEFCRLFSGIVGNDDVEIRSTYADSMYSLMRKKYSNVTNCLLSSIMFQDDFMNREFALKDMFD